MSDRTKPKSPIGEIIGEGRKLEVLRLVGAGSMGEVYAAKTTDTGELVAVKFLHRHLAASRQFVARFKREVAIARHVKSLFVAGIYTRDVWDGRPWFAFEWLDGESLQAKLDRDHTLSGAEVWPIIEDVLQGLADVHEAKDKDGKPLGIVHRDLKPANIFIERIPPSAPKGRAERARIVDFGISKLEVTTTTTNSSLTSTGAILGTPIYMAPEQGGASVVDARADLYAVGVLVFHMLSGQFPYPGGSILRLIALKRTYAPRKLSDATRLVVPEQVEQFVARAMAKEPAMRYGSARDALTAWRALLPLLPLLPRAAVPELVPLEEGGLDTEVDPPPSEGTFRSQDRP